MMENQFQKRRSVLTICAIAVLYAGLFGLLLQNHIANQKTAVAIENSRKVYIYNLEEVLMTLNIVEEKQKFEAEIVKLNDELLEAEKKIKSLQDAKVKENFSQMYLSNLRLKRDELIAGYEKKVKDLTDKVNIALAEIAKGKGASTIFLRDVVAVNTPYVEDVTTEVINRVK